MTAPTYLNTRTADMPTTEQLLREACTLLHNVNATFVPSNDSANAMCVSLCQRITALIAELRAAAQQSALDELVRENERLGLYDDQKSVAFSEPIAWMYQNANTNKMYLVWDKSDGGRNWMPLYAAPAPAQPRQPLSDGEADAILRSVGVLANAHSEFLREIVRATERAITGGKP